MSFATVPVRANGDKFVAGWVNDLRSEGVTLENAAGVGAAFGMDFSTNVGLTFASNILKLTQASQSDFDSNNQGIIHIPHTTDGRRIALGIQTATNFFEDAVGTSDITGMVWDLVGTNAWNDDLLMWIMAVNGNNTDDSTAAGLKFAITRNPVARKSPATSAEVGFHGNPSTNDAGTDFFFMTATNITASHLSKPCVPIGTIRIRKTTTAEDYTIQALDITRGDGIGINNSRGIDLIMPLNQMGSDVGEYITAGGGTLPSWFTQANITHNYGITADGWVFGIYNTQNAGDVTNGTGTNQIKLAVPYTLTQSLFGSTPTFENTPSRYFLTAQTPVSGSILTTPSIGATIMPFQTTDGSSIQNTNFSGISDDLIVIYRYKAF